VGLISTRFSAVTTDTLADGGTTVTALHQKIHKLDDEKMRRCFPVQEDERECVNVVPTYPRDAYIKVTLGAEADNRSVTVIILESENDGEKLEREPVQTGG